MCFYFIFYRFLPFFVITVFHFILTKYTSFIIFHPYRLSSVTFLSCLNIIHAFIFFSLFYMILRNIFLAFIFIFLVLNYWFLCFELVLNYWFLCFEFFADLNISFSFILIHILQ